MNQPISDKARTMLRKKKIVIAVDLTIFREALRALVSSHPAYEVVGEARDGLEAVRAADSIKPDMVLMNLSIPNMDGVRTIAEIKKHTPGTKILVLTFHGSEDHILAALKAGADGYMFKDANGSELTLAMETIFSGSSYLCPRILEKLPKGYLTGRNGRVKPLASLDALSNRERETLTMIAQGYKNKEIADSLQISLKTVEKHRTSLMRKLDLHSASLLTAFAIEKGIAGQFWEGGRNK